MDLDAKVNLHGRHSFTWWAVLEQEHECDHFYSFNSSRPHVFPLTCRKQNWRNSVITSILLKNISPATNSLKQPAHELMCRAQFIVKFPISPSSTRSFLNCCHSNHAEFSFSVMHASALKPGRGRHWSVMQRHSLWGEKKATGECVLKTLDHNHSCSTDRSIQPSVRRI